jgi:hypothetical protein
LLKVPAAYRKGENTHIQIPEPKFELLVVDGCRSKATLYRRREVLGESTAMSRLHVILNEDLANQSRQVETEVHTKAHAQAINLAVEFHAIWLCSLILIRTTLRVKIQSLGSNMAHQGDFPDYAGVI